MHFTVKVCSASDRLPAEWMVFDSEGTMRYILEKSVISLTVVILLCMVAADANLVLAVVLPPEPAAPEEGAIPSEVAPEPESSSHPKNPFEESDKPNPYETERRKRERTTIYIILAVVVLLCAYWWTSGKLHHRIPR